MQRAWPSASRLSWRDLFDLISARTASVLALGAGNFAAIGRFGKLSRGFSSPRGRYWLTYVRFRVEKAEAVAFLPNWILELIDTRTLQ